MTHGTLLTLMSVSLLSSHLLVAAQSTNSGKRGWLADHNYYRCLHGAAPVKWSRGLARKARRHAAKLNAKYKKSRSLSEVEHSKSYLKVPPSGENIAFGKGRPPEGCTTTSRKYDQHCAVYAWWDEYNEYFVHLDGWTEHSDYRKVGHFAAVVWKGVDEIGCAQSGSFYVCQYGSSRCRRRAGDCRDPPLPGYNIAACDEEQGMCIEAADFSKRDACAGGADVKGAQTTAYAVVGGEETHNPASGPSTAVTPLEAVASDAVVPYSVILPIVVGAGPSMVCAYLP
ncbi:hypothetical protein FOZ60_000024 [Perkinsus olseni]|uniref:SCP domain-containing protein n=1 Tax=Perkinsus olseni TaxID=32597 RepID=A0A7J6PNR8_PEROL|nr:hypothetical protein FOZ60_000024 [Perkinsus olseni]